MKCYFEIDGYVDEEVDKFFKDYIIILDELSKRVDNKEKFSKITDDLEDKYSRKIVKQFMFIFSLNYKIFEYRLNKQT